ncbi:MAG: circadian clock KaiB family protein [Janthinobacterium lividum]
MPDLPALEYELELFVAGDSPHGALALRNLQALCAQHLAGRYTLTVVDLHQDPARAEADGVIGLPMLLKRRPGLVRRLVGDLSDPDRVLKVLGLP